MTRKSQELKNKIIKELLLGLSVDPTGGYVNAKELSNKTYNSLNDYYFRFDPSVNPNWESEPKSVIIDEENILSEQDNLEICRAMIDDIKQNANEWRIEQEGELRIIKHSSGKKHYKRGFEGEEWAEIENFLSGQDESEEQDNYQSWTKEQLISEINRLKTENEALKNNQTLTSSEKQERIQENEKKLEELTSYYNVSSQSNNPNNNFPIGLVIGGIVLVVIVLISFLFVRKKRV